MTVDYGTDLSCALDFKPNMAVQSGRMMILETCVRRLITPLGKLRRHPLYGYDVTNELNSDLDDGDLARIGANVQTQLKRDTRIKGCSCVATMANGRLTLDILILDGVGPFKLVGSVTQLGVTLIMASS